MPDATVPNPSRRRARECAMQFLYGVEYTQYEWRAALDGFWRTNPARPGVRNYADRLIEGVQDHLEAIDEAIVGGLQHWTPDRIGRIERAILRVAVFEMTYADDVPRNVAINEAIEIAKRFGAEDAPRFVNGVLDRVNRS